MGLKSSLLSGDAKLEACLVNDAAHVPPGSAGEHVAKIQTAVAAIDAATIADSELSGGKYGPSTTAAVLVFKTKRNIINRRYESSVDPIVGKMTIAALDREMFALENAPVTCRLTDPCPCDVAVPGRSRHLLLAFAVPAGGTRAGASDAQVMRSALDDSRRTVRAAIATLTVLAGKLQLGNDLLSDDEKAALVAAVSWLRIDSAPLTPDQKKKIAGIIRRAVDLLDRSLRVRTSTRAEVQLRRAAHKDHARSYGDPDRGIDCGVPFFTVDGSNCRRDVITHEFLHLVGVHHGGGPGLEDPPPRRDIRTTAQALDSADNLAQLVAEITTPMGKTDACARPGE